MIQLSKIIVLLACLCIGITQAITFIDCPANVALCTCTKSTKSGNQTLLIYCVEGNMTISLEKELTANDGRFVRLDCGNETEGDAASMIPKFNVGHISGLQIQHCRTASSNASLKTIFNRLGVARASLARLEIVESDLNGLPSELLLLPQLTHFDMRSNRLKRLDVLKFRRLANLTVLGLGDNQLTTIPENVFTNFSNLRVLNLWNNSLAALQNDTFASLINLEDLDLSCNHIQSLAIEIFSELQSLTTINLGGNRFETLPEHLLVYNLGLEHFRLNNNRSPLRLPNKLFKNQINLKSVELSSIQCRQLPEVLFAHKNNLLKLSLARNGFATLPPNIFLSQTNLIELDLSHNLLKTLKDALFSKMPKLRVLRLSHNLINTFSESLFSHLKELTEVYLDNNKLNMLPSNIFQSSLRSLIVVNLSNNSLRNIIVNFHPFHTLAELDLSGNDLRTINESDLLRFSSKAKILTLKLGNSNIRHINFEIFYQTSSNQTTIRVDMQANPLHCDCDFYGFLLFLRGDISRPKLKLETGIMKCATPLLLKNRYVRSLKLDELVCYEDVRPVQCPQHCRCSTQDDVVTVNCDSFKSGEFPLVTADKSQKIVLRISQANIVDLPEIQQRIAQGELIEVYAQNNRISRINLNTLTGLRRLTILDFSGNQLTELAEDVFLSTTALKTLKLTANYFSKVEKHNFTWLNDLNELHMDHNRLETINDEALLTFRQSMRTLILHHNVLTTISTSFRLFEQLEFLDLSHNHIQVLHSSDLQSISNAKRVNINLAGPQLLHIDFKFIESQILNNTDDIPEILVDIQSNSVECDCDTYDYARYVKRNMTEKVYEKLRVRGQNVTCAKPPSLAHRLIANLTLDDYMCGSETLGNAGSTIQACDCERFKTICPQNCCCCFERRIHTIKINCSKGHYTHFPDLSTSMSEIHQRIGQGELIEVYAQSNQISSIDANTLKGLQGLTILDLSGNQLTKLAEDVFQNTTALKTLKLTANQFPNVKSHTFTWLNDLNELHMDYNRLETINEEALQTFRQSMRTLILHHNVLTTISASFRLFEQLETLDLSHNHIQVLLASDLMSASNAEKVFINLVGSQLTHINFTFIELQISKNTNNSKIVLNIQNNSLACDCDFYHYVRYERGEMNETVYEKLEVLYQDVTCVSPPALAHRLVSNLTLDDVKCISETLNTTVVPAANKTTRACTHDKYKEFCPQDCCCTYVINRKTLKVNCSYANYTEFPALIKHEDIKFFILQMEYNNFTEVPDLNKTHYELVTEIHMGHNRIAAFNVSKIPRNLHTINLTNNQLQSIDKSIVHNMNSWNLTSIWLAHNPWRCDCELADLQTFLSRRNTDFSDFKHMQCSDSRSFSIAHLCGLASSIQYAIVIVLVILLTTSVGFIFFLRYQEVIKVWMFAHNIFPGWVNERKLDRNKKYDAFVSFSEADAKFAEKLMKTLESEPDPYKLCVHSRDWAPGEWVMQQIINSVEESRRTIILLSPHFLASVWAKAEFRTAHQKAMEERRARVIIILVGDLSKNTEMEPELKVYLKSNTYVVWGDNWFWEKLRYALNKPLGRTSASVLSDNLLLENVRMQTLDKSKNLVVK